MKGDVWWIIFHWSFSCPLYIEFHALLSTASYTFAEKRNDSNVSKPFSTSSGTGIQSSFTDREVQVVDKSTESKELQEKSLQTELTKNMEDFYMLQENVSKSLDEMEIVINSASSSSNATTKSLADGKSFFNMLFFWMVVSYPSSEKLLHSWLTKPASLDRTSVTV